MGDLLNRYTDMVKQANQQNLQKEQIELLQKYAQDAEDLLKKENTPYTAEDITKVAEFLIDADLAYQAEQEKIAEFEETGRIIARAFVAELQNQAKSEAK